MLSAFTSAHVVSSATSRSTQLEKSGASTPCLDASAAESLSPELYSNVLEEGPLK